ncbi:MAG: hypothetical protein L0Y56_18900 [Nitrospira sp.]|nr:hypothetical protein [Nitrospira sp.]
MKIKYKLWLIVWISGLVILAQLQISTPYGPNMGTALAVEQGESSTLDLDQSSENETVQAVKTSGEVPFARLWLPISFIIYLLILMLIFLYVRKNQHVLPHASIRLTAFPASAKVLITIVLFMFSLVHALGLWDAYLQTHEVFESAEEYFGYMKLTKLISLSHPHLFGFALMYLLVGGLFILTAWSEAIKSVVLTIPILSAIFDVFSWWMIKMASSDFELLTIFTGVSFGAGFGIMTLLILKEMWLGTNHPIVYQETVATTIKKGKP